MPDRSRASPSIPDLAPDCGAYASNRPPRILSPPRDQTIVLRADVASSDQELPLEAESDHAGAELSWFVNGTFIGSARADERVWWEPAPGEHELVVMDDAGHASRRVLRIR